MLSAVQTERLAADLVSRIQSKLPVGFRIRAAEGAVRIESERSWAIIDFDDIARQEGSPERHVARAVHNTLSAVQDFVVEELHEPWPRCTDQPATTPHLPMPEVVVDWPKVRFWFGSAATPVLQFEGIEVEEPSETRPH